jgi:DNA-binding response OmpR family regulator
MSDKKKIFIADDDEAIVSSLRELLVLSGFEVKATQKAKEVMPLIKGFLPDLIILDLFMPDLGGLEICEMLNNDKVTQAIPIIVVSALGDYIDIKRAYRLGVVNYLVKPYEFKKLLREINKAIVSKERETDGVT